MKVGDLVSYAFQVSRQRKGLSIDVGLIVETGKYTGNTDVKVLWSGSASTVAITQKSAHLRVINESR
jgi:hypothetical protein